MSHTRKRRESHSGGRRTRRRACFEEGTYVTWRRDGAGEERKEGCVGHDNGRQVNVIGGGDWSFMGVTLDKLDCNVHESKWRRSVKVGDIVEVKVLDQKWHPSLVRAVQNPGPRVALVVEPVFLGYAISVPLYSFKVRSPQVEHCELQSLLDMGLAFDDFNKLAATHPEYHPFGSLKSPGAVEPCMRCYYHDGSTRSCWVVQAPCILPDNLRLVRDFQGVLRFCLECNLLPPSMNSVAPVLTEKAKLGSVTIPLWHPTDPTEFSCKTLEAGALVDTMKDHLRRGDDGLALKVLFEHQDPLLTLCTFDGHKQRLAEALCAAAHKPYSVNRVAEQVWQHGYGGKDYFVNSDLESMHTSLKRILAGHPAGNIHMQELVQLDVRVNMWRMYKNWYGQAHDLRLALQCVQPLQVSLSPDSLQSDSDEITFDVHANYSSESLYERNSRAGSRRLHCIDSDILENFTKYALGAHPTSDPPLDERVPAPAFSEWTSPLEESFESMLKRVCGREDSVVDAVLHHEHLPFAKLEYCLSRKIECEGGRTLFWNACEGVVKRLVVDSTADVDPELLSAMTQVPPPQRHGGVLVHDNATDKMNCVVDILKTERQRPGPADRGSTIIYTTPTLIYAWHHHLAAAGIDAHVFHGSNRRNEIAVDAMNRGDVIIASWSALQSCEDVEYLGRGDVPEWRAFVDEFNTSHFALANGIIHGKSRNTWLLCRRCDLNTLALALPLLNVRPFCFRSGWNALSHPQSDFATRRHIREIIEDRHTPGVRSALVHLCRSMVLCQTPSAPVALAMQRSHHACTSAYTKEHAGVLQNLGDKIVRDSRQHDFAQRSDPFIINLVKRVTMACWGVMPPVNLLADRIGFGRYATDAAQHLHAMRSTAELQNSVQQESQKEARLLVRSLRDKKPVDAQCPVCFDNLFQAEAGNKSESAGAGLTHTVVVGQCGHAVCGECADNIMRTAAENLVSGANDYGPTAPVNSACCPICRHAWAASAKRPLMMSTAQSAELHNVAGAVFKTNKCPSPQDLAEGNPLIKTLTRVCDSLAAGGVDHGQGSASTNVVVVCRSQELVSHLHGAMRCKHAAHKTYKISRSTTPKARGKALAEFAKTTPSLRLKVLFVTASLVRGMVFHRTRHYAVVEDLKEKEAEDLKYAMHASLLTFPPGQRHEPVTVHAVVAPLCPSKGCARGVTRVAPAAMILPAKTGCIPTRRSATVGSDYISRIHAFFRWPPRKLFRVQTSAAAHPHPLSENAATRDFNARLDALLALESELSNAPQAQPHSLRVLLENQPTTAAVPQASSGVHI